MLNLEEIIQNYKLNEKGEREMINRFNFETEDSGEVLIRLNCVSHNYDRKKANKKEFDWGKYWLYLIEFELRAAILPLYGIYG